MSNATGSVFNKFDGDQPLNVSKVSWQEMSNAIGSIFNKLDGDQPWRALASI